MTTPAVGEHDRLVRGDQLVLAVSRQLVKDASTIEDDGRLDKAEVTAVSALGRAPGSGGPGPRVPWRRAGV